MMDLLKLVPGVPTLIPGTRCEVRWDGDQEMVLVRQEGFWDLSPLTRRGRVMAWQRLADRPHLGWWPLVALPTRTTYRSRNSIETAPNCSASRADSDVARRSHHHWTPSTTSSTAPTRLGTTRVSSDRSGGPGDQRPAASGTR